MATANDKGEQGDIHLEAPRFSNCDEFTQSQLRRIGGGVTPSTEEFACLEKNPPLEAGFLLRHAAEFIPKLANPRLLDCEAPRIITQSEESGHKLQPIHFDKESRN